MKTKKHSSISKDFKDLIRISRQFVKKNNIKKSDVAKAIKKV